MNKKLKKCIIIIAALIGVTMLILLIGLFYVLFTEKDLDYFMSDNMKNVESIELIVDANKSNAAKSVMIYDKEVIDEIMEKLGKNKLKPYYSESEGYVPDKGVNIRIYGQEKERLYYHVDFTNSKCIVDIGASVNGKMDEGMRYMAEYSFDKEAGEELCEYVEAVYESSIRNIEISDIRELGRSKEYDWKVFKQFMCDDVENMGTKVRDGLSASHVAKFEIKETNAYMYVWYLNGTIHTSKETNEYQLVMDAIIYDEAGNSMSIYDEGLDEFLEELK